MKNIILIVNIKKDSSSNRETAYNLSIDSWRRWAENYNSDVFVLDSPVVEPTQMAPNFQRMYAFDLLDASGIEYDQILMVDADTIVHPQCPNFFELSNYEYCAVHNDGDYDWVCRSIENYEHEFFYSGTSPKIEIQFVWEYFNTGFIITNKKFKFIHDEILNFYWNNAEKIRLLQKQYGVGTDQPLINMLFRNNDWKIKILPYRFNMQDLTRKNILDDRMLFAQIPGVYHFNAIPGGKSESDAWIKKTHNHLFNRN